MTKQIEDLNLTENEDDLDEFRVPEVPKKSRMELLKERATAMGITFSPNIGEDTLAKKIQSVIDSQGVTEDDLPEEGEEVQTPVKPTRELSPGERAAKARKAAMKLIRIVVHPMDPLRSQLEGEIITGGNGVIGTISKYVPFNAEQGYYVPEILYKILRDRKYLAHFTTTDSKGREINRHRLAPAFNVVVLPDLSEKELKRLAMDQRARQGRADYED